LAELFITRTLVAAQPPIATEDRTAVVVCSGTPFPVTTGGRKRSTRLLEAIERAGAVPHILVPHRLLPEDERAARAEAELRGWPLEDLPYPPHSPITRIRQHARREMNRRSPLLVARLHDLAQTAVFIQFEEIGAMQYVTDAPSHIPAVVSSYNVDSAVESAAARNLGDRFARARARYRAQRLLATERRAASRADLWVCVTTADRSHFTNNGARDVVVIPNGVDEDLFALPEEPPSAPRVLFFGSYLWEANAAGLVRYIREVWPRVVRELPGAELRVVGPGPLEVVRQAASETSGVTIVGFVPDLLSELRMARVVVAPIWFGGGTRLKVLEALAAARPVVGTTVGVERIGFEDDFHGLIGDDPETMAVATLKVLLDDKTARRYAHNARDLAKTYRWRAMTAPLEQIYRDFIERRRGAA
jgi:polysaccharide biosynthesis protein PslH